MKSLLRRTGTLLLACLLALALESLVIGVGYSRLFTGAWEMHTARVFAVPIALAAWLLPSLAMAAWSLWWERAPRAAQVVLALLLGAWSGAALALAPTGQRFGALSMRFALGAIAGAVVAAALWWTLRRGGRWLREHPQHTPWLGAAAALAAACFWWMDARWFPRQYPSLHALLLLWTVLSVWLSALALRRLPAAVCYGALALSVGCAGFSVHAAKSLQRADNLRLVLLERAPWLGRAVQLAAQIAPVTHEAAAVDEPQLANHKRSLHWNDKSVLLVTIDAMRADHTSAYGYARRTTPFMEQLAQEGTRFDYAYCPTPHTSYSMASLMTGKYMHPLRAMGLGEDSQTWADLYRLYGYRTAAFYPPAVFFVDQDKFERFRDHQVGFEYAKVEFADGEQRLQQVRDYLAQAPSDTPLFLWVHLFDPHEPYQWHPEFPFSEGINPTPMDAYDSEIAMADQTLQRLVEVFSDARPEHLLVVTADHGEEFDEHGGRYHGSSVYEEQVRVPLLVRGEGVKPGGQVAIPVQLIDLLPTFLSANGTPRPPRLRGRDLGALLAGEPPAEGDEGFAFAEVAKLAMVARGTDRLVCRRAENACALYDVQTDPLQSKDLGAQRPERVRQLRGLWQRTELDHGRLEGERGARVPPALRRGLQGDREAAPDVAALLDDVDVQVRRTAAAVLVQLASPDTEAALSRVAARSDEDPETHGLALAALSRVTGKLSPELVAFVAQTPALRSRRLGATVLAERGDATHVKVLLDALDDEAQNPASGAPEAGADAGVSAAAEEDHDLDESEAIAMIEALRVLARTPGALGGEARAEVLDTLVQRLADVRLRVPVVHALAEFGDVAAKKPLLEVFAEERNFAAREPEARALLQLRAANDKGFQAALKRFAAMPEPLPAALALAREARLLTAAHGAAQGHGAPQWKGQLTVGAAPSGVRLWIESDDPDALRATLGGAVIERAAWTRQGEGDSYFADVPGAVQGRIALELQQPSGVRTIWALPLQPELPPPPPEPWQAGQAAPAP